MQCGKHRVFDSNFKACVLKGSTRNIRKDDSTYEQSISEPPENSSFKCAKKKPGKYPDERDCHIYHLCLQSDRFSPFEHLVVECPHSSAYDHHKKRCSKIANKKICEKK